MNTQIKVWVGVRLRLGLRFIISKKKGNVNMNMQTKVGVGVGLRLGLGFIILEVKVETNAISAQHSSNWS